MKRRNQSIIALTAGFLFLFSTPLFAGVVEELNEFHEGKPAVAEEVNENFDNVKKAVDDNNARIDTISSGCEVGSSIRKINDNGIVECQPDNIGDGDITAIIAGNGLTLTGSGDSGDVTISVKPNSIGVDEIATNGVGSDEIANGSIINDDISRSTSIDASKINRDGLNADLLDDVDSSGYVQQETKETVVLNGDLVVAGELDVSGDLIVPNVVYDPVHTHYLSIPACAFRPLNTDGFHFGPLLAYVLPDDGGLGEMIAAVYLPDDAIVTSLRGYFFSEDGTASFRNYTTMNLSLSYYSLDGDGPDQSIMASVKSQASARYHSNEDTSISNNPIINRNRAYFVKVSSNTWMLGAGIRGASITYTISEAP